MPQDNRDAKPSLLSIAAIVKLDIAGYNILATDPRGREH